MAIKCTNGGTAHSHESVDEVRRCWNAPAQEEANAATVMDNLTGVQTTINPPSVKQVTYVLDLLSKKVWPDSFTEEDLKAMERRQVSELINGLLKAPRKPDAGVVANGANQESWEDIPGGRYALEYAPEAGSDESVWKFFQVDKGKGRWEGRTFLKLLIGSPGAYREQKLYGVAMDKIMKQIRSITPRQASIHFGLKSETCGVCSSPLTHPDSLKYGIGPKCRAKTGW